MHKCIMVKIGGDKKPKLNENKSPPGEFRNFAEIGGKFRNFVEIRGDIQYASLT